MRESLKTWDTSEGLQVIGQILHDLYNLNPVNYNILGSQSVARYPPSTVEIPTRAQGAVDHLYSLMMLSTCFVVHGFCIITANFKHRLVKLVALYFSK